MDMVPSFPLKHFGMVVSTELKEKSEGDSIVYSLERLQLLSSLTSKTYFPGLRLLKF